MPVLCENLTPLLYWVYYMWELDPPFLLYYVYSLREIDPRVVLDALSVEA